MGERGIAKFVAYKGYTGKKASESCSLLNILGCHSLNSFSVSSNQNFKGEYGEADAQPVDYIVDTIADKEFKAIDEKANKDFLLNYITNFVNKNRAVKNIASQTKAMYLDWIKQTAEQEDCNIAKIAEKYGISRQSVTTGFRNINKRT